MRTARTTDRRKDGRTDTHDETNSHCSQFWKRDLAKEFAASLFIADYFAYYRQDWAINALRHVVNKLPINTKSHPRRLIYIYLVLKTMLSLPITDIESSNPGLERHIILNTNFRGFPLRLLVTTVMALQGTQRPSPFTPDLVDETVALRFKAMMQNSHQTQKQSSNKETNK